MQHHAQLVRLSEPETYEHAVVESEVRYFDAEQLRIDDARELQRLAHLRPVTAADQVLIIRTKQILTEAQNALLKLFEEPPSTTRFVLVVTTATQLLPTLQSRVIEEQSTLETGSEVWDRFVSAPVAERLEQIEHWHKQKDPAWLQHMQTGLHGWATQIDQPSRTLQLVVERLGTRGASNKMLLEALALDAQLQNS